MRDQLIRYLNNQNMHELISFLQLWIRDKMPEKSVHEVDHFIRVFLEHVIQVPSMFDPRYQNALSHLIDRAKAELCINSVSAPGDTNKIIKYY